MKNLSSKTSEKLLLENKIKDANTHCIKHLVEKLTECREVDGQHYPVMMILCELIQKSAALP